MNEEDRYMVWSFKCLYCMNELVELKGFKAVFYSLVVPFSIIFFIGSKYRIYKHRSLFFNNCKYLFLNEKKVLKDVKTF